MPVITMSSGFLRKGSMYSETFISGNEVYVTNSVDVTVNDYRTSHAGPVTNWFNITW